MNNRWEKYFLNLAEAAARQSKQRTKVGAVISDQYDRIISTGFNGLPRGIEDTSARLRDRDWYLKTTLHAEENALAFARQDLTDCRIYVTHTPCAHCAALIIQHGIKRVVVMEPKDSAFYDRWTQDNRVTMELFNEAGVELQVVFLKQED